MVGKICTVCRRCSYVNKQLSFFTYPGDPFRRHEWLIAVDRMDLMDKLDNHKTRGNHRICEVHFEGKYIKRSKLTEGRKFLSKDAFPTLCLATSSMITANSFVKANNSLVYAQNIYWKEKYTLKQGTMNMTPKSTTPKYNLRSIKQEHRKKIACVPKEEDDDKFIEIKNSPSPIYEDASQFCESVIKVSQSTQTPRSTENNKRKLIMPSDTKRIKFEETNEKVFLQMCSKFLSPSLYKLIKWQVTCRGGEEHMNSTLFALNLYYSSNLYNLLGDMLSLPSIDTLKYFLLPKTTRLSENFLNTFRCKINNMTTKERICSFSVGSTLLKPNLYYDIKYDRIIGLHDINGVQNIFLAKYVILLMVQGILENWRQPIAYAFISEYDNTSAISTWIDETLTTLIDIGLDVRAFVSDPRSEFLYASDSRFVTSEKTHFTINGTDIFYTYDTTQLLKIVRNNLKSCDFYCGRNFKSNNNVEVLKKISDLCNVLNAKTRFSNSQYKRAYSNRDYQKIFLNRCTQLFNNLKVVRKTDGVDVTENMKFIQGFQITINSVLHLYEELNFLGVKYLLTSRLNHNCLNSFFARAKQSYCKEEITPRQFNRYFVRNVVFNMLKKPLNCNNNENSFDSEEFSQQLLDEEVSNIQEIPSEPLFVNTTDYRENLPDKNAFVYVCGYCYLKCIQIHCCDAFQSYLNSSHRKQENNDIAYLCSVSLGLKVRNCNLLPPDDFTEFVLLLERKFKEFLRGDNQIHSIGNDILREFEQCGFGMPCPCFPIDYLKALFVRVRLFYTIRKNNKLLMRKKGVKSLKVFSL